MSKTVASLLVPLAIALLSSGARADVPPPDSCNDVGAACTTAGPGYDQPGTCVTSTCTRATPSGPMSYECSRCVAGGGAGGAGAAGGAGGTGAAGGAGARAGAGTGAAAGSGGGKSKDDGGCSFSGGRGRSDGAGLLLGLGLAALVVRRRAER